MFIYGVITAILLLVAGIETHPGPQDTEDQMANLTELVTRLSASVEKGFAQTNIDINTFHREFSAQNELTQNRHEELQNEIDTLKEEISVLKKGMQRQDKTNRKNNIIVHGICESDDDKRNFIDIGRDICSTFNVGIEAGDISDAFRIGSKKGKRPILISLTSFSKKIQILQEYRKCNDGSFKIANDVSQEERALKIELQPYCNEAIKNGQRAFIRNGKLIVNGKSLRKEDLPPLKSGNAVPLKNRDSFSGPSTESTATTRLSPRITRQTRGDTDYTPPQNKSFSSTREETSNRASRNQRSAASVGIRDTSSHVSPPPQSEPSTPNSTAVMEVDDPFPPPKSYANTVSGKRNNKKNNVVGTAINVDKFKQTIRRKTNSTDPDDATPSKVINKSPVNK
jgi:hypothetical protein